VQLKSKSLLALIGLSIGTFLSFAPTAHSVQSVQKGVETCRLGKVNQEILSAGFPRYSSLIPSTGNIRSLFLYVDFPDNKSTAVPKGFTDQYALTAKKFLETQSYGRAKFTFESSPKVYRINKKSSVYQMFSDGQGDAGALIQDAINAADAEIDFGKYDFLTIVPPKNTTTILSGGAITGGADTFKSAERNFSSGVVIGKTKLSNFSLPGFGWSFYSHEVGHVLGITHPFLQRDGEPAAIWDLMGNGGTSAPEFISWHRFLLDWLTESEIACFAGSSFSNSRLFLTPLNTTSKGKKMVVITLNAKQALVIEVRRASTYDKLQKYEEGTIVYRVDVSKGDDKGIITILGNKGTKREGQILESIKPGESVTSNGYVIKIISSSKSGDTVEISKG
jgi:M6 family metalloprotease-like protein